MSDLDKLLGVNENETIEWKETYRWNVNKGGKDRNLKEEVSK